MKLWTLGRLSTWLCDESADFARRNIFKSIMVIQDDHEFSSCSFSDEDDYVSI